MKNRKEYKKENKKEIKNKSKQEIVLDKKEEKLVLKEQYPKRKILDIKKALCNKGKLRVWKNINYKSREKKMVNAIVDLFGQETTIECELNQIKKA